VFTTNPKEIEFTLNYESNPAVPDDIALFEEVAPANTISNDLFDHTDETGTTYTHTQLLTGGLNAQVGSVIAIPVGMGDTLNAEVFAKYKDNTGNGNNSGAAIAGLLINAFTGGTGMTNELGNQSINNNFGSGSLIGTTGFAPEDASAPMAFLNMMFLPEGETIDLEKDVSFAYDQIDGGAEQPNSPTKAAHDRMHVDGFVAPDQGYVLVYLSNESAVMTEVYFDDLKITVNEHPVVQRDDYMPFGLTFNSYQRITSLENRFRYNGKERIKYLGLDWDDYGARMYMADIGRWGAIDPLASKYSNLSPYNYVANNPIIFVDPNGEGIFPSLKKFLQSAKKWVNKWRSTKNETYCNFCVRDIVRDAGDNSLDNLTANEIGWKLRGTGKFKNNNFATEIGHWEASRLAKEGVTIIASYVSNDGEGDNSSRFGGHVALVAPTGYLDYDEGRGEYTPYIMQAGSTNFTEGQLSKGFGTKDVKFFIMNHDKENLKTFDVNDDGTISHSKVDVTDKNGKKVGEADRYENKGASAKDVVNLLRAITSELKKKKR
ncbi:MAG: RHS repeat-associated core domain-containing protein, partial [Bacteroidota bacterium]